MRIAAVLLAALLLPVPPSAGAAAGASDAAIKAAFLFNFVKFTEWPALTAGTPIVACIAGGDDIAAELSRIVKTETAGEHAIAVREPRDSAYWQECQILFVGSGEQRAFTAAVASIRTQPVLTVSDQKDFSRGGGIIELYIEQGRLRFAINLDAAERAKLRLSARLLGLAKVVRDGQGQ